MIKLLTLFLCCVPVFAGNGTFEPEEPSDWRLIADQVWQRQEGNTTFRYAEGVVGMQWVLERTDEQIAQAEQNYYETGETFWLERIQDLEGRFNKLSKKMIGFSYDRCFHYQTMYQNSPEFVGCTPLILPYYERALAYAGPISGGGGVETEAHVWAPPEDPSDITLICNTFANGIGSSVYINEPGYSGVGITCADVRYGSSSCYAYAYAEAIGQNSYFEMESGANECFETPPPPPPVYCVLEGPTSAVYGSSLTYSARVYNGSGRYDYKWFVNDNQVPHFYRSTYLHTASLYESQENITVEVWQGEDLVTSCYISLLLSEPLIPLDP